MGFHPVRRKPSCLLVGALYSADKMSACPNSQDGCATDAKKARPTNATWPLGQSLPRSDCESRAYLWYAGAGACAQHKEVAPAATPTFDNKTLLMFLTSLLAQCCPPFYMLIQTYL